MSDQGLTTLQIILAIVQGLVGIATVIIAILGLSDFLLVKNKNTTKSLTDIFSKLALLSVEIKRTYPIGFLPYYVDLSPIIVDHRRYDDAVKHMKLEKGDEKLNILIQEYKNKIGEMNKRISERWETIDRVLRQESNNFGINGEVTIKSIQSTLNAHLLLGEKKNFREWINDNPPTFILVNDSNALNCLVTVIQSEEVIGCVEDIKKENDELLQLVEKIKQKAVSISDEINDADYDVDAECCPSLLKTLKRIF